MSPFGNIKGKKVAIVGCGTYPIGKGLGNEIDACDVVIRANRAYRTEGIEADYGTRTDHLLLGNIGVIGPQLPRVVNFKLHARGGSHWKKNYIHNRAWIRLKKLYPNQTSEFPEEDYFAAWKYTNQTPYAGTCAAIMAAYYGAGEMLIVGLDMYDNINEKSAFAGHANMPPINHMFDLSIDEKAILNLPCDKVKWIRRQK